MGVEEYKKMQNLSLQFRAFCLLLKIKGIMLFIAYFCLYAEFPLLLQLSYEHSFYLPVCLQYVMYNLWICKVWYVGRSKTNLCCMNFSF